MKKLDFFVAAAVFIIVIGMADNLVTSKRTQPIRPTQIPLRYFLVGYSTGVYTTGMLTFKVRGAPNMRELTNAIRKNNHLSDAIKIVIINLHEFPSKDDFDEWMREPK